jgi:hypothetical protein
MRVAAPVLAALALLITAAGLALAPPRALAFDSDQFCIAARQVVRSTGVDVGTWIDRTTRYDGYDIGCDLKTVHFKRFHKSSGAPTTAWMERQAEIWESAYCNNSLWRDGVANGWVISATVTTASGARVWLACLPTGKGFYRVMQ